MTTKAYKNSAAGFPSFSGGGLRRAWREAAAVQGPLHLAVRPAPPLFRSSKAGKK
jgi:hypothetical protein